MNPTDAANVAAFLARQIESSVGRPDAIASLQRVLDHLNAQIKRLTEPIGDGGPAFPVLEFDSAGNQHAQHFGVSMRDYFAGKAMVALLPLCNNDARAEGLAYPEHIAAVSYGMADAMLKARSS